MKKFIFPVVLMACVLTVPLVNQVSAETEGEVKTVEFFSDLDPDTLIGQAAANLRQSGVIGGYPNGTFQPDRLVNRAELAKFLLLAREREVGHLQNNGRFPDVLEGEWYVRYVMEAADLGVISGYPSGNFKPAQAVNTAEFLKMLVKNFYLEENLPYDFSDVTGDEWFAPFAGVVSEYDLFPIRSASSLAPAREMTRGEVAIAIYKMMVPKEGQPDPSANPSSTTPGSASLQARAENEIAQMSMTYPGKDSEVVLLLRLSLDGAASATVKNLRLSFSNTDFLDDVWIKGGQKVSAYRKTGVTVPVDLSLPENSAIDVYASVRTGLTRGDMVKVTLDKIEWEAGGVTQNQEFPVDGYELMIF